MFLTLAVLTRQERTGIPEGLTSKGCAAAASAENGDKEAQQTIFEKWEKILPLVPCGNKVLSDLLCAKCSFPRSSLLVQHSSLSTVTDGCVVQGKHVLCAGALSAHTRSGASQAVMPFPTQLLLAGSQNTLFTHYWLPSPRHCVSQVT